jgi:hypothetical protein
MGYHGTIWVSMGLRNKTVNFLSAALNPTHAHHVVVYPAHAHKVRSTAPGLRFHEDEFLKCSRRGQRRQTVCKPGSVPLAERSGAGMAIPLGRSLPSASCDRPERRREGSPGISGLLPRMPAAPTWSCSRWGFPSRRRCRRCGALLPHRFTLAGRPGHRRVRRCTFCGTFPGVAPAGCYPAPCLRGARTFLFPQTRRAAIRPSGAVRCGAPERRCQKHLQGLL